METNALEMTLMMMKSIGDIKTVYVFETLFWLVKN